MRAAQRGALSIMTILAVLLLGGINSPAQTGVQGQISGHDEAAPVDAPSAVEPGYDISLGFETTRSDEAIETSVENALDANEVVESEGIEVSVDAGVVTLTGEVDSVPEKILAMAVSWAAGAADVDSIGLSIVQ